MKSEKDHQDHVYANALGNQQMALPPRSGIGSQGHPPFDEMPTQTGAKGNVRGLAQADGNQSDLGPRPTRAPLQTRTVNTRNAGGMDGALSDLADQMHPPKTKGPRSSR